MKLTALSITPLCLLAGLAYAQDGSVVKITDIQGSSFQSPFSGQYVEVTGVVTAKVRIEHRDPGMKASL